MSASSLRRTAAIVLSGAALVAAGCGSDGDEDAAAPATTAASAAAGADLGAVKGYLLAHTERLTTDVDGLVATATELDAIGRANGYDAQRMLRADRARVATLVQQAQDGFAKANPAYEEMEGVVAGVPELADFDVQIDAGGDASDPENAVAFSIKTSDGRTFAQPGNLNYLMETAAFGTESKWSKPADLDGDGEVAFGEAVPDPRFYLAAAKEFQTTARDLDASARRWSPTLQDALTALVVMTPTMSEYFDAWKSSRFVAGEDSTEKAFVVASRLQDISDILGGLVTVYDSVEPSIASVDGPQARQTGQSLVALRQFSAQLLEQEQGGKRFTASDADTLGGEAQDRAEAIAGQVSQAAGRLNIELES